MAPLHPGEFGDELSDQDKSYIDFEREHGSKRAGRKQNLIFDTFGHTETRYYQRLNHLIDSPHAAAYDSKTVSGLRAKRDRGRDRRAI